MANIKIESVTVRDSGPTPGKGLKGQNFRTEFGGCDLLMGPNGAGKTTRGPLAITAAIEGLARTPTDSRRPYLGVLPVGTSVALEVGGRTLVRDLALQRGRAYEEINGSMREVVGLPPTAWDLSDFARGTDGDRGRILDAVARAGGQLQKVTAKDAQERVGDVDENGEARGALKALVENLPTAKSGAEWLEHAITWAESNLKRANLETKNARGALNAFDIPQPIEDIDEPLTEEQLLEQIAEVKASGVSQADVDRHRQQGERLRLELEQLAARGKRLSQVEPQPSSDARDSIANVLKGYQEDLASPLPEYTGTPLEELARAVDAEDARVEALEAMLQAIPFAPRASIELADAKARAVAPEHLSATCRHCDGVDPLGLQEKVDELESEVQRLEALNDQQAERSKIAQKVIDATAAVTLARQRLADARASVPNHDQIREARKARVVAWKAKLSAAESAYASAVTSWQERELKREAALVQTRKDWGAVRDELKAWQELPEPGEGVEAPDPGPLQERLKALREHAAKASLYAVKLTELGKVRNRVDAADASASEARALVKYLRQVRDEVAAEAYLPIHNTARALLEDAAPGLPLPYFVGPADYGADIPGRGRTKFSGLSESEQRITAAAIVYALAVVANCPCRLVLLDGVEVVQPSHRAPLIAALARAVKRGDVDNVVITMAANPGDQGEEYAHIPGLTIHAIERVDRHVEPVADTLPESAPF